MIVNEIILQKVKKECRSKKQKTFLEDFPYNGIPIDQIIKYYSGKNQSNILYRISVCRSIINLFDRIFNKNKNILTIQQMIEKSSISSYSLFFNSVIGNPFRNNGEIHAIIACNTLCISFFDGTEGFVNTKDVLPLLSSISKNIPYLGNKIGIIKDNAENKYLKQELEIQNEEKEKEDLFLEYFDKI